MSSSCDNCGSRNSEVKPGGPVGAKGRRWELMVTNEGDLNRDVLKSDSAGCTIPHIDFEMQAGTLGSVFTTVEGLLIKAADSLAESIPFTIGDSAPHDATQSSIKDTTEKLRKMANDPSAMPFRFVLTDIADQSFISCRRSSLLSDAPPHGALFSESLKGEGEETSEVRIVDPQLTTVLFDRSYEDNELLGLNDMRVD